MIPLLTLEQNIQARLETRLTGLAVESFPARPADYRLTHPKGVVLIAYSGSDYGPVQTLRMVVQDRTVKYSLVLMVRNLRTHSESLPYLDVLRVAMAGFVPAPGAEPCVLQGERFLDESDGVWSWELTFSFELPLVEDRDAETGTPLAQVTAISGLAQIDIAKTNGQVAVTEIAREEQICGFE